LAALKQERDFSNYLNLNCDAQGTAVFLLEENSMSIRGIRGATTVSQDTSEVILDGTRELLKEILLDNPSLKKEDLASAFFTVTDDLCAVYPAKAARQMGWELVPLMCAREISVPDGIQHCIRVLLHWNTSLSQREVKHIYLHAAARLRPDLGNIESPEE
jgi:chorismate mutase